MLPQLCSTTQVRQITLARLKNQLWSTTGRAGGGVLNNIKITHRELEFECNFCKNHSTSNPSA